MRLLKPQLWLIPLLSLTYCSTLSLADSTKSDYDRSADFANIHTYSWGNVKTENPLYVDRVKNAVNRELQAKGWNLVPNGGDTTIFAMGEVRNEKQMETTYNSINPGWGAGWGWGGWGWGPGGGFGTARTTSYNRPVANLVIDIFATSKKNLLWRGVIERDIDKNADKNIKALDKNVAKLFKKFPPKGES